MNQRICAERLKRVHDALEHYADAHAGLYPEGEAASDGLQALYAGGYLSDARDVVCPASATAPAAGLGTEVSLQAANLSYLGGGRNLTRGAPGDIPVLWDDRPRHDGARNVLMLDGQVLSLTEAEFQTRVLGRGAGDAAPTGR